MIGRLVKWILKFIFHVCTLGIFYVISYLWHRSRNKKTDNYDVTFDAVYLRIPLFTTRKVVLAAMLDIGLSEKDLAGIELGRDSRFSFDDNNMRKLKRYCEKGTLLVADSFVDVGRQRWMLLDDLKL